MKSWFDRQLLDNVLFYIQPVAQSIADGSNVEIVACFDIHFEL